ncbi:MAG: hypothetical protein LIO59_03130, partial [Oscillospiraceae bacterium]|nr:hypothetical protein [Oscillospiraceae bacterium]
SMDGSEILEKPMEWNIFRAPTDNDRNIVNAWRATGYDRAVYRGFDAVESVIYDKAKNGGEACEIGIAIESSVSVAAAHIQQILEIK